MSIVFYVLSTPQLQPQFNGSFTWQTAIVFAVVSLISVILFQLAMGYLFGATKTNIFIVSAGIALFFTLVAIGLGYANVIVLSVGNTLAAFMTSFLTALVSLTLLGATTKEKMIVKQ